MIIFFSHGNLGELSVITFCERLNTERYWNCISRVNRLYIVIHFIFTCLSGANIHGFEEQLHYRSLLCGDQ